MTYNQHHFRITPDQTFDRMLEEWYVGDLTSSSHSFVQVQPRALPVEPRGGKRENCLDMRCGLFSHGGEYHQKCCLLVTRLSVW